MINIKNKPKQCITLKRLKKNKKPTWKNFLKNTTPPQKWTISKSKRTQQSDLDIYRHKLRVFATMLDIWTWTDHSWQAPEEMQEFLWKIPSPEIDRLTTQLRLENKEETSYILLPLIYNAAIRNTTQPLKHLRKKRIHVKPQ